MNRIQRYLFSSVLRAAITIIGGLSLLALLAQGLSQTDLIVDNRQSALTYLKVVALGAPQIVAILGPLALFVAALNALNRSHRDNEIVVSHSAGMTRWQVLSPMLRLATLVAIIHLCVNLFVQPMAQREMRVTIADARADLAASLIRPGAFSYPTDGLTIYAREVAGGELSGMLISDSRKEAETVDYIAEMGYIVEVEGEAAIRLINGQIQQLDAQGQLSILNFDDYIFELTGFLGEDSDLVLKPSDRFLSELFFPDMGDYYQNKDKDKSLAEAHGRLSSPILNFAMIVIAVIAVIGGDFSRRGYARRVVFASTGAIVLIMVTLTVQPAAADDPSLNFLQYLVPILTTAVLMFIFLSGSSVTRLFRKKRNTETALSMGAG